MARTTWSGRTRRSTSPRSTNHFGCGDVKESQSRTARLWRRRSPSSSRRLPPRADGRNPALPLRRSRASTPHRLLSAASRSSPLSTPPTPANPPGTASLNQIACLPLRSAVLRNAARPASGRDRRAGRMIAVRRGDARVLRSPPVLPELRVSAHRASMSRPYCNGRR